MGQILLNEPDADFRTKIFEIVFFNPKSALEPEKYSKLITLTFIPLWTWNGHLRAHRQ